MDATIQLITADWFVPVDKATVHDAGIAINNGMIIMTGTLNELRHKYPLAEHHHYNDSVLMPGLINPHAHLEAATTPDILGTLSQSYGDNPNFVHYMPSLAKWKHNLKLRAAKLAIEKNLAYCLNSGVTTLGSISVSPTTLPL